MPCLISCSLPPSPSLCSMRSLRSKNLCSTSAIQCSPSMLIYSSQAMVFAKYQNIHQSNLFIFFSSHRRGLFPIRFSRAGLSDCKTFLLHCNSPCSLLLGHWYEIMALYYVKSVLTEISASRQDRRVLQKSKIIRIEFLSKWGMLQTSRYV